MTAISVLQRPRLAASLRRKLASDMKTRLQADGQSKDLSNDYERHLYARHLFLAGKSFEEIAKVLIASGLADVMPQKREKYIEDVLTSPLVVGV